MVSEPNCGQKIVSSKHYIVAACAKNSVLTVYDARTKLELCTVNGNASGNLGAHLSILDHDVKPANNESRLFSTIYASGYVSATNLHYVSEIHIIPDYNTEKVSCVYDPSHIVEKTIASPAGSLVSS